MLLNCGAEEDSWNFFGLKEIKPVYPKGNQPWIFFGRTDAEAEAPILWPPDVKRGLIGKGPDAGKDWGQEEKGTDEDEMVIKITNSMDTNLSKLWKTEKDRGAWHGALHGVKKSRTSLSDWTTIRASVKLKIYITHDSKILLLNIYSTEMGTYFHQNMCIRILLVAIFILVKSWTLSNARISRVERFN